MKGFECQTKQTTHTVRKDSETEILKKYSYSSGV